MKEDNMKQGWEIKKLGEVCTFCSGYTPKENEFKKCATIPVPYFKVSDMNHLENHKYLTYTTLYLENGCKTYPKHTIVFPKNGAAIATNKKRLLGQDSVVDLNTGGVIANDKIVFYEYLYLFLLNLDFRLFTRRGAVPTLDIAELKKQTIPVPPLPVQEQIVSELDLLSGIIEKKREQLKELDALAQSIFYDMFGDPITNEKGWEVKKLGEVCDDITDGDHMPPPKSETGIPFLTISDIDKEKRELNFNDTFFVPQEYYDNLKENRRAKKGDVLYTVTGSYGIPVIVNTCKHFCFQRHIALLKPKQENLLSLFLCQWFLCEGVKFMADQVATGIAQKTVSLTSIRKFEIILPPLPLQHQFATKIEAIEKQKELIKQSISETETLFNARMQHYFN